MIIPPTTSNPERINILRCLLAGETVDAIATATDLPPDRVRKIATSAGHPDTTAVQAALDETVAAWERDRAAGGARGALRSPSRRVIPPRKAGAPLGTDPKPRPPAYRPPRLPQPIRPLVQPASQPSDPTPTDDVDELKALKPRADMVAPTRPAKPKVTTPPQESNLPDLAGSAVPRVSKDPEQISRRLRAARAELDAALGDYQEIVTDLAALNQQFVTADARVAAALNQVWEIRTGGAQIDHDHTPRSTSPGRTDQ